MTRTSRNRITPPDIYIKNYSIQEGTQESAGATERIAKFLHDFSEEYPGDRIDRASLARIAFRLPAKPKEGNIHLSKLSYYITRAEVLLMDRHKKVINFDRVSGYRASTGADDIHDNKLARALRTQDRAIRKTVKIANLIDPRALTGKRKEEFVKTKGILSGIEKHSNSFPQLLDKNPKDE